MSASFTAVSSVPKTVPDTIGTHSLVERVNLFTVASSVFSYSLQFNLSLWFKYFLQPLKYVIPRNNVENITVQTNIVNFSNGQNPYFFLYYK